nr:MAG TPA: hypothetical protein [Caudoviricetes sp.]DAH20069.1 MAG TPA: hypothetical protein [Caudoviricetes sp.]
MLAKTYRLLLFVKFNTKIFSFSLFLYRKGYLCTII